MCSSLLMHRARLNHTSITPYSHCRRCAETGIQVTPMWSKSFGMPANTWLTISRRPRHLGRTKHYPILMRIRRKTSGSWTPEKSAKAHAAKARKRMESPPDQEPCRVPAGELLGVVQWHAADGAVRRWTIKQGQRMNSICVCAQGKTVECGWDHLFRSLRKKLSTPKRILA